ncbi:antibiotic biosynthesis monooxygenase family protein [Parapedomonas caeni]
MIRASTTPESAMSHASNLPTPALTPPYVAVIFTSLRPLGVDDGYDAAAEAIARLATTQPGYLGMDSVRDPATGLGITVAYWRDEEAVIAWRDQEEHAAARVEGRARWYDAFSLHVAKVERSYDFTRG